MKRFLLALFLLAPLALGLHTPQDYSCASSVVKQFADDAGHLARVGSTYYTYDADDNFYYSPDGGVNWVKRGEKGIEYLTSAPDAPLNATSRGLYGVHEYLAANTRTQGHKAVVYRSTNGGSSWEQAGNTLGFSEREAKFKAYTTGYSPVGWSQAHAKYYLLYPNDNWYMTKDFSNSFPSSWSVTLPEMLHYGSRTWAVVNGRTEAGQQQTKIYSFYSGTYDNFTLQSTLTGNAVGNAMIGYGGALYLLIKTSDTLSSVRRSTNLGTSWATLLTVSNKIPLRIRANSTHGINIVFSNGEVYRSWDGNEWKLVHNINQTSIKDLLFTTYRHSSLITAGNKVIRLNCNAWPVARFTNSINSRTVEPGTPVTLSATPSFDSDKDTISFLWVQASGTTQNILNRNSAVASVNISQPGTYVFTLKLRDNGFPAMPADGSFSTKNFTVTVLSAGATPTPTSTPQPEEHAEATPIPEEVPEPIIEPTPLATATPTAETTATPTVEATAAPTETPAASAIASPTPETIEATPSPAAGATATPAIAALPVIAASDATGTAGEVVALSASATDPQGMQLSFSWRQLSGSPVELSAASSPNPSLVPPVAGTYEFEVTATASDGRASTPARVRLTASASASPTPPPATAEQQNAIISLLQQILDIFRRLFGG